MKRNSFIFFLAIPLSMVVISGTRYREIEEEPEDNRFTKTILAENLDEPMAMTFLPGSKVLIIERKGVIKIYDPKKKGDQKDCNDPCEYYGAEKRKTGTC